jgi:fructokinase
MRIGVDLGGTKIEAVLMAEDGAIRARRRIAAPAGYETCIAAIAGLVSALEAENGVSSASVGVGMPGSPNPVTGLIRNANSTFLNARPFGADLAAALNRPVRLANDADCFALSEAVDGAGAGAASVFGVILGTGCGGGLVLEKRLVPGAGGNAGEWGHIPLPWPQPSEYPGPLCWCGKHGCLETFISGPAFLADAKAYGRGQVFAHGAEIAAAATAGDPDALAALERLADRAARGLAVVANIVDPAVIVLGGGLSNINALPGLIQARLGAYVFSDAPAAQVVKNVHGDSSGVRGAAWLWPAPAR